MANDILIVDDEADIRMIIAGILQDEGYTTREAGSSAEALSTIQSRQPSLIILDVWLQNSQYDGLQMLEMIRRDNPDLQVVMISGHGTIEMAVRATKMGAYDFIEKPFKSDVLLHTIERALEAARLRQENRVLKEQVGGPIVDLTGNSPAIGHLRQALEKVAPTDSRVLITGSPGSGKEVVARLLHDQSNRAKGPYRRAQLRRAAAGPAGSRAVRDRGDGQCGAPRRHAGAGAWRHAAARRGRRHAAGDPGQDRPRAAPDQRFERVGGEGWVEVDVRVIATTNRDLKREIDAGQLPRGPLLPAQRRAADGAAAARCAATIFPMLVQAVHGALRRRRRAARRACPVRRGHDRAAGL